LQGFLHNLPPPYLTLFLFLLSACVIALVSYLSSAISGWYTLSRRFTAQAEPSGDGRTVGPFFYTIYWRLWTHYNSIIRVTAAPNALYLTVNFLLRIGHPPLAIPWSEIQFSRTRFMGFKYVELTLGSEERIPMRISERMARNLGILDRVPA